MAEADGAFVGVARSYSMAKITSAAACFAQQASHLVYSLRCGGSPVVCYTTNSGSSARMARVSARSAKTLAEAGALSFWTTVTALQELQPNGQAGDQHPAPRFDGTGSLIRSLSAHT